MSQRRLHFFYLNLGHFLDHLFMLIFASVAALRLSEEWGLGYSELIPYATPGFVAFGVCALISGWLADKWSREGMMVVFFTGIGVSSILCGLSNTPVQIAITLTLIGIFASIYHPVGLSMVVQGRKKTGIPLAINGVFGNMGVACAALITGYLIDTAGWKSAFYLPGAISLILGLLYYRLVNNLSIHNQESESSAKNPTPAQGSQGSIRHLVRVFSVIFFTTALGGLIFQSTTFALPKVFDEQLAVSASMVGWYAFVVFSVAAFAQLVVGYLVDHYSIRMVFAIVAAMQAALLLMMSFSSGLSSILVAIGFMLAVFGQIPINDVLVGRMAKSQWRSRAYAARYIVTFSVMASAVPLIAWIHEDWGFSTLFILLAITAALIFLATLILPGNLGQQASH